LSVWLTIPSKRPPEECAPLLKKWKERGYNIALWRDMDSAAMPDIPAVLMLGDYPGYAAAVNQLIRLVMEQDSSAEWFIAAGDDIEPDANHSAEEIAAQCKEHFQGTFGVMQPTGDRWGDNSKGEGAYIDRVAGSAWIGRDFAERMYQGKGPLYHEYTHMFVDEELQCVAEKYGVFWQRRDLIHMHKHWGRGSTDQELVNADRMPEFLKGVNSPEHWRKYKALFESRKAQGFPGSEPL